MTMVVTEPCRGCKDKSCLSVCPAECFYEDSEMLYIDPDECVDCAACVSECPVEAIFYEDDVPEKWKRYLGINAMKSKECLPAALD
ncbi:indolepyruvate ferredoxin oxidoreductase subunit alpha [Rhodopirellula sp. SWK7]|uniref:indolepyruvate ferredoxin oxidoreductase subunit alpha n=1 Tax=Rhodopirellula sp. SWK7 TaxID=595460 RepID=UPI0002BD6224|nr:4Fe-4S dicluster domain-containing protein [Rhodopirellula sp. SWK7]EMI44487.1 4Fe-4S ferredoxin iron-sulfur binding domain protein [Rhodopirellula sp. SWK7]